jgi:hypothetical protein
MIPNISPRRSQRPQREPRVQEGPKRPRTDVSGLSPVSSSWKLLKQTGSSARSACLCVPHADRRALRFNCNVWVDISLEGILSEAGERAIKAGGCLRVQALVIALGPTGQPG